ncbi:MAG TPA: SCP2 sterol-binding domain-containing protein [Thermoleophilaceae bacterium]|nr:SCP2 sterol-binding domain-containing protein [Thermoleophilaceae bacterium]
MEIDPAAVDPSAFVKAIGETPDDQLAAGMANPEARALVLDGIFGQMAEHFRGDPAAAAEDVVEWQIKDRPGGGVDRYQVVMSGATCRVEKDGDRAPRVTLRMKPVDFLKLVTGNAAGPMMFMTGKLKIDGDLMFAATIQSRFRIPAADG